MRMKYKMSNHHAMCNVCVCARGKAKSVYAVKKMEGQKNRWRDIYYVCVGGVRVCVKRYAHVWCVAVCALLHVAGVYAGRHQTMYVTQAHGERENI